jgi:25S rRNA (cytosine2870-C5)-methyltransferase
MKRTSKGAASKAPSSLASKGDSRPEKKAVSSKSTSLDPVKKSGISSNNQASVPLKSTLKVSSVSSSKKAQKWEENEEDEFSSKYGIKSYKIGKSNAPREDEDDDDDGWDDMIDGDDSDDSDDVETAVLDGEKPFLNPSLKSKGAVLSSSLKEAKVAPVAKQAKRVVPPPDIDEEDEFIGSGDAEDDSFSRKAPKKGLLDSDSDDEDDEEIDGDEFDDEDDDDDEDDHEEEDGDEEDEGDDDDDEDEDEDEEDEFDDDEDDDDEDDDEDDDSVAPGDIVAAQARLNRKIAEVNARSTEEMKLAAAQVEGFHLPTPAELQVEREGPPNLQALQRRITDIVGVLIDFRNKRNPLRARKEYMECFSRDLCNYYGYNDDLIALFSDLFSPPELVQFLEANETPRPVVIRVNSLKTTRRELAQALVNRGVHLEPLASWSSLGLKIFESPVPVGATPEYLSGHYMLQSASSFVPCISLQPQPNERILDMCAAPGGKTTYIAQLMQNTGILVANDVKKERIPSLQANIARLGIGNTIVTCLDGRVIPGMMKGFDRILLDAPCTGLGVISRDPSVKTQKTKQDVVRMSQLQKQLILAAIDALELPSSDASTGNGILVYSTCSITVEENEAVVNYLLKKRHVKILPTFAPGYQDVGRPGLVSHAIGVFHPSLALTRRYYPHEHNMDGFYVARIKKLSNKKMQLDQDDDEEDVEDLSTDLSDEEKNSKKRKHAENAPLPKKKAKKPKAKAAKAAVPTMPVDDAEDEEPSPSEPAVVSFMKEGDTKKKRKAGRRVQEAKEQKSSKKKKTGKK